MGYVEMVKWDRETLKPYVLWIDEEGEMQRENAKQCDICLEQRRESKVMTVFIGGSDDWNEVCDKCRIHR